jgi:TPR repeat protein
MKVAGRESISFSTSLGIYLNFTGVRSYEQTAGCAVVGETSCQVRLAKLLLENASREERDFLQAIAWLELAAEDRNDEARLLLSQEQKALTPKQVSWVEKLKSQLVQKP